MENTIQSVAGAPAGEGELPVRVQEALGELAAAAREGLLALSVGVGLGVLAELMEEEVVGVVGAKGCHDSERVAVRHGHEAGEVTLGGRRVGVERPRVRSADGTSELSLVTYRHFADRDPLTRLVLERMLAGSRRGVTGASRSLLVLRSSGGRGRCRSRPSHGRSCSAPAKPCKSSCPDVWRT